MTNKIDPPIDSEIVDIQAVKDGDVNTFVDTEHERNEKEYKRKTIDPATGMTLAEAERKLTDFQRKIVHNIIHRSMKRDQAAKAAGSNSNDKRQLQQIAYQVLNLPHVRVYYDYQIERKNSMAGVDKIEVIEKLREVIDASFQDAKYKDTLKALELLGSSIGLFKTVSKSESTKRIVGQGHMSEDPEEAGSGETEKKDIDRFMSILKVAHGASRSDDEEDEG